MHQAFLALLILERKQGDRAAYTGQAIQHFQAAQEVYTQEQYPDEWANVQTGLLAAYRDRDQADQPLQLTYPQFYEQELGCRQAFRAACSRSTRSSPIFHTSRT